MGHRRKTHEYASHRHADGGADRAVPGGRRPGRRRHRHDDRLCHGAGDQPVRLLEFRQGAAVHVWRAARWMRPARRIFTAWWSGWRQQAQLPMPKVFITENPQPNAFATGRNPEHAAVCVTTGLLAQVSQEELAGVLAHELGHVKHRDTLTMTITAVMAGAISMLANMAFFMGGSRDREQSAGLCRRAAGDHAGAHRRHAGAGRDLALPRIRGRPRRRRNHRPAAVAGSAPGPDRARRANRPRTIPPTPIPPRRICSSSIRCMAGISGLFATHPSTEERIARLRAMAGGAAVPVRKGPWG